jgi:anaerobic selenocysteine-containing dehydrogenase
MSAATGTTVQQGLHLPQGASLGRLDEDPDRLTAPVIRANGEWREAGWQEAFTAVEQGLSRVPGPARAVYLGNPNAHTMAGALADEHVVDPLSGNAVFNGVPVTIAAS